MLHSTLNLLLAICLLVFGLAVFHFFVLTERPDSRFLKKVDYWWLGFSALSIISLTVAQRQQDARARMKVLEIVLKDDRRNLIVDIARERATRCSLKQNNIGQVSKDRQQQCSDEAVEYGRSVLSRKTTESLIEEHQKSDGIEGQLYGMMNFGVIVKRPEILQKAKDDMKDYNHAREEEASSPIERGFSYLYPYLLALALALRITKVSGELLLDNKKELAK